jgi:thiamine pyrophosphate-dependent acetolactate synthase large subunit-like protein
VVNGMVDDNAVPPLRRREAVALLLEDRGDLLVVSGLGSPSYDVHAAGDRPGNFYLWGAMGGAALVGLGLALARPDRNVVVVTGDGEQLMGLGGLATIGVARPRNLTIVVIDNGRYGETGMQVSHTGLDLDLSRIAAACGFGDVRSVGTLAEVSDLRDLIRKETGGPRFYVLKVTADAVERSLPFRDAVHGKNRFRAHLGLPLS